MNDQWGQVWVLTCQVIVFGAISCELLPRLWILWRLWNVQDGLRTMRLVTALKSAGMALLALWGTLVRLDLAFTPSAAWFPTYLERWRIDGPIWTVLAIGAVAVAWLYWHTVGGNVRSGAELGSHIRDTAEVGRAEP